MTLSTASRSRNLWELKMSSEQNLKTLNFNGPNRGPCSTFNLAADMQGHREDKGTSTGVPGPDRNEICGDCDKPESSFTDLEAEEFDLARFCSCSCPSQAGVSY